MRLLALTLASFLLLPFASPEDAAAQQWVKTNDGRVIILHRDGSWEYASSEPHADSPPTLPDQPSPASDPDTVLSRRIRVFVTDSQSWETSGGIYGDDNALAGHSAGGARPQTAEIIKTIAESCPEVTVTSQRANADFVLVLDHEGGKGWGRKDNKVAVFAKNGDLVFSGSTRVLGNAVTDACAAIMAVSPWDPLVDDVPWGGMYRAENLQALKAFKRELVTTGRGTDRSALWCFRIYLDLLDTHSLSVSKHATQGMAYLRQDGPVGAQGRSCRASVKEAYDLLSMTIPE